MSSSLQVRGAEVKAARTDSLMSCWFVDFECIHSLESLLLGRTCSIVIARHPPGSFPSLYLQSLKPAGLHYLISRVAGFCQLLRAGHAARWARCRNAHLSQFARQASGNPWKCSKRESCNKNSWLDPLLNSLLTASKRFCWKLLSGEPGFASSTLSLSADTCWTTRVMLEQELRRITISSISSISSSFLSLSRVNLAEPCWTSLNLAEPCWTSLNLAELCWTLLKSLLSFSIAEGHRGLASCPPLTRICAELRPVQARTSQREWMCNVHRTPGTMCYCCATWHFNVLEV